MNESEVRALLDAHDALLTAYVDSSLTFSEFVSAYGEFPRNYSFDGDLGTAEQRAARRFFRSRIAFHLLVSGMLSGLRSADDPTDIPYGDAGRFLPAVQLMRLRELIAKHPDFKAEPEPVQ
ncbi:MAG: hypothetical protein ACLPV8_29855 [Steroidobacteraceae bacterium]